MDITYERITSFDCDSTAMAEASAYACDALVHAEPLQVELDPVPFDYLESEGFDAYTGLDTALSGKHDAAMLNYGFALLGDDE